MLSNENKAGDGSVPSARPSGASGAGTSAQSTTEEGGDQATSAGWTVPAALDLRTAGAPQCGSVCKCTDRIYALFRANVRLQELHGKLGRNGEHRENSAWELFPPCRSVSSCHRHRGGRTKAVHAEAQKCASRTTFLKKLLKDTPRQNNGISQTVAGRPCSKQRQRNSRPQPQQQDGRPRRAGRPRKGNRNRPQFDVFEHLEKIHHASQ